jgi:poly(hydroxyalkanoate) granule-associated protein
MARDPITIARKGALAYIGALALTGDQVAKTFGQLVERGKKVDQAARSRFAGVEKAARKQIDQATRTLRGGARENLADGRAQVAEAGSALASGRDRLLDALNLPTHDDILKLNFEVERLSGAIDELRKKSRRQKAEVAALANGAAPLPGYEKLNAEAVVDRLGALDEPTLLAVRAYELEHGNRVTVLRAVERTLIERQAARGGLDEPATRTSVDPLPRYDELTAEEVIERLAGLNDAELLHVKVYEQEHGNRVTVLRAVVDKLTAKVPA